MTHTIRGAAFAMCAILASSGVLVGCGSGSSARDTSGASLPPIDASQGSAQGGGGYASAPSRGTGTAPGRPGMSTGTKVALLAGAAALYYMYKKNQQKRATGDQSQPQYYLSKNGRVYYRDRTGRAVWVTPPQGGIQVPYAEAQPYQRLEGYERGNGMSLQDFIASGAGTADEPAMSGGRNY